MNNSNIKLLGFILDFYCGSTCSTRLWSSCTHTCSSWKFWHIYRKFIIWSASWSGAWTSSPGFFKSWVRVAPSPSSLIIILCIMAQYVTRCHKVSDSNIIAARQTISYELGALWMPLSTSLLVASCICCKVVLFVTMGDRVWSSQTPPIEGRYHLQGSTPYYSCAHW